MKNRNDLREYQKDLIEYIKINKKSLLAVDMGLGKTISCLTAIKDLIDKQEIKKILIVAPLRVAQITWPDELKEWDFLSDLTYTVIKGNEKQRLKIINEDKQIYIINKELIPWFYENSNINFDMIVWDESSSLKNTKRKTKLQKLTRFGAFVKLSEKVERIVLLSGTPTPNGLEDIFGQIFILDRGKRLGGLKSVFYMNYFNNVSNNTNYALYKPKTGSYEIIMKKIEDLVIKMKTEDYLQLPEFLINNIKLDFSLKDTKIYEKLMKDYLLSEEIVAVNETVLIQKLLQLSNGCIYKEDKSYEIFNEDKIDYLEELINENDNENILLFYNFKFEKDLLEKRFKNKITFLKNDEDIKKWNNKEIKLLACHPASAGHGLNLQKGGNICIWLSLTYNLELYLQANKRLHRSGQKNNVICYHIIRKNSIEEQVLNVLNGKIKINNLIESLIKNIK